MRKLSVPFINDLKNDDGMLHTILERVKKDDTLMLAIREDYINIYYRGGNILKITEETKNVYKSFFDENYDKLENNVPDLPKVIKNHDDAQIWVEAFPRLKEIMDCFFSAHGKPEREFQQLVVRENNFSSISEYCVTDIEYATSGENACRFDMLAIHRLANTRKYRATLIEMKYGDGALKDQKTEEKAKKKSAGILKHLRDFESFILNDDRYHELLLTMESQFNQLKELGLLRSGNSTNVTEVKFDAYEKPEVIIILANHNPRSTKLKTILNDPDIDEYENSKLFDLRFYVSTFAGYGLYENNMLSLKEFRDIVNT